MSEDQGTPTPEDGANADASDESALEAAKETVSEVQDVADSAASGEAQSFDAPELGDAITEAIKGELSMLSDVHMDVRIELGRTRMYVEDVLKLNSGAVVELDKLAGDPVDVFVNDRRVARGEVLVLNDMFCVRINEVVDITHADD